MLIRYNYFLSKGLVSDIVKYRKMFDIIIALHFTTVFKKEACCLVFILTESFFFISEPILIIVLVLV